MKTLTTCWPASSLYLRQVTMPTYHMPGQIKRQTLLCLSGKISFSFDCHWFPPQSFFHLALNSWLLLLLSKAMGFPQDTLKTWSELSLPAWSVVFSFSPDIHVIAAILPIPPHLLFPLPCLKMVEEDEIESSLFIIMTPSHLIPHLAVLFGKSRTSVNGREGWTQRCNVVFYVLESIILEIFMYEWEWPHPFIVYVCPA